MSIELDCHRASCCIVSCVVHGGVFHVHQGSNCPPFPLGWIWNAACIHSTVGRISNASDHLVLLSVQRFGCIVSHPDGSVVPVAPLIWLIQDRPIRSPRRSDPSPSIGPSSGSVVSVGPERWIGPSQGRKGGETCGEKDTTEGQCIHLLGGREAVHVAPWPRHEARRGASHPSDMHVPDPGSEGRGRRDGRRRNGGR